MRYLATAFIGVLALSATQCQDGSVVPTGTAGTTGQAGAGSMAGSGGTTPTPGTGGTGGVDQTGLAGTGEPGGTTGSAGTGGMGDTGGTTGAAGTTGDAGTTGAAGTTGVAGTTGAAGTTGRAGTTGAAGTTGRAGTTGAAGTTGVAGTTGAAGMGMAGTTGAGGAGGERRGPFRILVLQTALEYRHPSIADGEAMLRALGMANAPERARIPGLDATSTWTIDVMGSTPSATTYFSEVTAENLAKYELFYSNNPTGPVFTNAPSGATKKQIFQDWHTAGGSWAGHHAATDFEKANGGSWNWWHDNIDGSYFDRHDLNNTPGTVVFQPNYVNHPILRGLTTPWNVQEEWYLMIRNVETVAGFQVLAKVTVSGSSLGTTARPAIWIKENSNMRGGRAFYTIRGHDPKTFAEPQFRDIILRGILWSVHRLPGGG